MNLPPIHTETVETASGPRTYLVRYVSFKGKNRRVRQELPENAVAQPPNDAYVVARAILEGNALSTKARLSAAHYETTYLSPEQVEAIEFIRWAYEGTFGLMSTSEQEAYERDFEVRYVQGTTTIEGNTLSLDEARAVLEGTSVPEGKSLREINEVQNFRRVARLRDRHEGAVTKRFIRELHGAVMANIDDDQAGRFRRTDAIGIAGCDIAVAPSAVLEEELDLMLAEHEQALRDNAHPFEQAVLSHYRFEIMHPFTDGNGRVGRELLNHELTRAGYPRMLFLGERREEYLEALRFGNEERWSDMVDRFAGIIIGQRLQVLSDQMRQLVQGSRPKGQSSLVDFS